MSHNYSSVRTKHIKKKAKPDVEQPPITHSSRRTMNLPTLEPRRDLPLHKIPELLAKITGTLSSTLSSSSESKSSTSFIDRREQLFENYSDEQTPLMSIKGILRFCADLSIEPDSYSLLLFCFLCRAKQMYSLTKEEFFQGLKALSNPIDNFFELRQTLVNYPVNSEEREFYLWIYHYGLVDGQRCLTTPNAISLWRLFYSKDFETPSILNQWLDYLQNDVKNEIPKTITCDTWSIFPHFAKFIQSNGYEAYDDNEAWPYGRFHCFVCDVITKLEMSKPALKPVKLKPFQFEIPPKEKTDHSKTKDINPIIRPNSSSSSHRDLTTGELRLPDKSYQFTSNDLIDRGVLGEGNFGVVCKMEHQQSGTVMAVKRIHSTVDEQSQKQMLNELDIVMRENNCPHIVLFYGALFKEGDCWICMELMNASLDYFYKFVYHKLDQSIPESVLAYIVLSTLEALDYIKSRWSIIHRDVKPSNILVSRTSIKLCDFGISGELIDSIARTRDAGCRPYLPPERIDPTRATLDGYDVRSDVWSFGITIYEIATGYFPFREWKSVFDQLQQIVEGPPIQLTIDRLSDNCKNFVNTCLNKDVNQRPKYKQLLAHSFLQKAKETAQEENSIAYLCDIIDSLEQNTDKFHLYYYPPNNSR